MKKENIYIDLSKYSEEERKHIFSLLPKSEFDNQYRIDDCHFRLSFDENDLWWVYNDKKDVNKTELTYPEFIKLFEGGEVTWNIFKPHTGSTETETMGCETIKSDNTETLANALRQIEKMEADKAELLEALVKANRAIMDCDWNEDEGSPHLIPIYEHNQSLIQKHKQ